MHTYDIEVIYSQSPGNIALLKPTTRVGPLDLLGNVDDGLTYDDLLPHSRLISINKTVPIRVLDLDRIIGIKKRRGTERKPRCCRSFGERPESKKAPILAH